MSQPVNQEVLLPDTVIAREQRSFLQLAIDRTGWTMTELARRAGINHSTLSKFLANGGRDGHVLRFATIRKIENAAGVKFSAPGFDAPAGQLLLPGVTAGREAQPYVMGLAPARDAVVHAALGNAEHHAAWIIRSAALEASGIRPGDVVIVDLQRQPRPGEIACAQIVDWKGGGAETVFRHFRPPSLVAATSDETLLQPFIIDNTATVLKGTVTGLIRAFSTS